MIIVFVRGSVCHLLLLYSNSV